MGFGAVEMLSAPTPWAVSVAPATLDSLGMAPLALVKHLHSQNTSQSKFTFRRTGSLVDWCTTEKIAFGFPDVNECTLGTHTCTSAALCRNTVGSYTCLCEAGFRSTGPGQPCVGGYSRSEVGTAQHRVFPVSVRCKAHPFLPEQSTKRRGAPFEFAFVSMGHRVIRREGETKLWVLRH